MGVVQKLIELRWRAAGHYTRPLPEPFTAPLRGARALEIGGPSAVFATLLPAYELCAGVDGVQFAEETVWHGTQSSTYHHAGTELGTLHVTEGDALAGFPDGTYDAILSSHVIEHFANPLRALEAWQRVCRPAAALVMVAPHKAGTFDHRRPVTPLAHMISDYERGTGEDDLTHLDETLRLHDRSREAPGPSQAVWEQQRRENVRHRMLHHHVFTTRSLVELLAHAGVDVHAVEVRYPHDIYVVGRFASAPADPEPAALAAALRRSPLD
jgi:SAM-dependent methyltransferase